MMTDMTIKRTGLTGKSRFAAIVWAVVLSLAFPAPMAASQATGEGGCRFPDVPATSPAHADITYACRQGWFSGYPDGSFRPDRSVPAHQLATVVGRAFAAGSTRADMATFLRGGAPGDPTAPAGFSDVPATHPQNEDIAYAVERSWFQGYPDNTFRPDRTITTRQITTVLTRAFPTGSTRADLAAFLRNGQQSLNAKTEAQPSPSSTKIAYTVPVYDSLDDKVASELWIATTDGSSKRRLTGDVGPRWRWSPGGEGIAYEIRVRDFRGNVIGSELWVAGEDGSDPHQLTDSIERLDRYLNWTLGWDWSPSGERIAFEVPVFDSLGGAVGSELWVAGEDGSGARRLSDVAVGWKRWDWSPDGELIAYEVGSELWVADKDGSGARRLVDNVRIKSLGGFNTMKTLSGDYYDVKKWRWSSDGKWIGYVINRRGGSWVAEELWVVGVDGLGARRLTDGIAIYNMWLSPDGERVVYETRVWVANSWETVNELWVVGVDGSGRRQLTDDFAYNWSWSPGGGEIAYQSRVWEFGKWLGYGLLVADVDGSGARRLTDDLQDWWWSPDGERIAYEVKVRDSRRTVLGNELWVASADGSGAHRLTDDVAIEGWRWSPDGEWIVYGVKERDSSVMDGELWMVGVDGSGAHKLIDVVALIEWRSSSWDWSPGGENLAYGVTVRDSRGNETATELWVAGADGSGARKIADNIDNWRWQPGEG